LRITVHGQVFDHGDRLRVHDVPTRLGQEVARLVIAASVSSKGPHLRLAPVTHSGPVGRPGLRSLGGLKTAATGGSRVRPLRTGGATDSTRPQTLWMRRATHPSTGVRRVRVRGQPSILSGFRARR
jgi:hypothetical protein